MKAREYKVTEILAVIGPNEDGEGIVALDGEPLICANRLRDISYLISRAQRVADYKQVELKLIKFSVRHDLQKIFPVKPGGLIA